MRNSWITRFALLACCAGSLTLQAAEPPLAPTLTHPSVAASRFTLWREGPSGLGPHVIESTDSAGADNWLPVPGLTWPTLQLEFTDPRPAAEGGRFYRLSLPQPTADRGRLISATFVRSLSKFEIQFALQLAGVTLPVNHEVRFYRLEYETVGPLGETTTASGGLALPVGATSPMPFASYQHGTEMDRSNVPSALNTEALVAVAMAASGYIGVAPDYLGMGTSAFPYHPYHHAKTEATAVVDMLRAARIACFNTDLVTASFNTNLVRAGEVFLAGYSQGGHATLAAHREIERYHANEFHIVASAPGAGAHDLSGATADDALSDRVQPNPYYFAYLLYSFQRVYGYSDSLASLLRAPYDTDLPPLFDGKHTGDDVNARMPNIPKSALKPAVLAAVLNNPDHPLRRTLRDNDLLDWAPKAPIRIFHCKGDDSVVFKNAEVALARLKANGATSVELFDGGDKDHGDCAFFALLGAKQWFDTLK